MLARNGASLARNFALFGYAIIPLDVAGRVVTTCSISSPRATETI